VSALRSSIVVSGFCALNNSASITWVSVIA
jgi:hypothetical protein